MRAMKPASALDDRIDGPARWSLRLFGGFELSTFPSGERVALPGKRERVLLAYLRNAGLVDYWRARGWPDHCRAQGADDFVCD